MQGSENVSSLMDGELTVDEAAREIARLKVSEGEVSNREAWDTYHLIGDAMRHGNSGAGVPVLSAGFSARFSERLAQEPTVLAPRATRLLPVKRRFQTIALSAAASVAAIAVVGWMALSNVKPDAPTELAKAKVAAQPQIAAVAPQTAAALIAAAKPTAAPDHMHEYLLAHQGISPSTAIQGVAPYIRTVSNAGD